MPIRAAAVMVLTFTFGIVPATLLLPYALLMSAAGIASLFVVDDAGGALSSLVFIATAPLAVYGYIGLFHAAGDAVTRRVAWCLAGGVAANAVAIGLLAQRWRWFGAEDWFVLFGPFLAGCAHLLRFGVKRLLVRSRRARSSRPTP